MAKIQKGVQHLLFTDSQCRRENVCQPVVVAAVVGSVVTLSVLFSVTVDTVSDELLVMRSLDTVHDSFITVDCVTADDSETDVHNNEVALVSEPLTDSRLVLNCGVVTSRLVESADVLFIESACTLSVRLVPVTDIYRINNKCTFHSHHQSKQHHEKSSNPSVL